MPFSFPPGGGGGGGSPYTLPVATASTLGGVKSDATTVSVAGDGTLSTLGITSKAVSGTTYSQIASDLTRLLDVTTGSADTAVTLISGLSAGANALQVVRKVDTGTGRVIVKDSGGVILATLTAPNEVAVFRSNGTAFVAYGWRGRQSIGYTSGRYYSIRRGAAVTTGVVAAVDTLYASLIELWDDGLSLDALAIRVTTGQAGGNVKFALYDINQAAPWKPDGATLLAQSSSQSASSGIDAVGTFTAVKLPSRFGWFVTKWTATSTLPSTTASNEAASPVFGGASATEAASFSANSLKGFSGGTDAYSNNFPTTFPASTAVTAATLPFGSVRIA